MEEPKPLQSLKWMFVGLGDGKKDIMNSLQHIFPCKENTDKVTHDTVRIQQIIPITIETLNSFRKIDLWEVDIESTDIKKFLSDYSMTIDCLFIVVNSYDSPSCNSCVKWINFLYEEKIACTQIQILSYKDITNNKESLLPNLLKNVHIPEGVCMQSYNNSDDLQELFMSLACTQTEPVAEITECGIWGFCQNMFC